MIYVAFLGIGIVAGIGIGIFVDMVSKKPRIHTCSKHNYTGTEECPDCRAMTPCWNLYIGEKEFDVDDMSYAYIAGSRKSHGDFLKWIDHYREKKQEQPEAPVCDK